MKSYERRVRIDAEGICQNASKTVTLTCPECSESIDRAKMRDMHEYAGELDQYGQDVSLDAVTFRAYYCPECRQEILVQFENNITPFQSFAELAEHIKEG